MIQPSIFRETLKNQPPVVTMKRPVVEYAMSSYEMGVSPFRGRINSTYLLPFNAFYGPFYCSDESSGALQGAEGAEQEALCQAAGSAGCQHEAPEGSAGTHQQDQTVALQQGKQNQKFLRNSPFHFI